MKNLMYVISCLVILITTSYSQSERWIWFASDEIGNMYYDSETLTGKYSGYPVLWVKTVYSKDEYHEGKKIDYRLDKIQIFCTDRTLNFLGSYYYFVYETTPDNAPSPGRMESVIPGTIGEALYDKICSK